MMASGYSIHLYCDAIGPEGLSRGPHGYDEFPHEFTGETFGECARSARRTGWRFKRDGTHICPKCNRPRPTAPATEQEEG